MPSCSNCSNTNAEYHLCSNCYNNKFKSLYCDGHCGRKCDPSQRTGSNIIALPWWWYCNTCRQKRENPNLPPDTKRVLTEDEIDKLQKKLKKLEEENQIYLQQNQEYKEKNKEFEEKNQQLLKQTEGFTGQYHDFRNKLENFYDIIVDVDSLRHITKGWKVKFTPIGKEHYDIMKDKEVLIIGVVGNRNRGKSFVLSKLSKQILPDGTSIKTEGISIKYPEMKDGKDAKYILMDSAGFENALLENDEFKNDPNMKKDEAQQKLKLIASDKTLTEYFIQNFIIQKSNILVLVIGILNYPEQKLLNRIKTENENKFLKKKGGLIPPLFVVHNLQTFSLIKQVEDYIKETLLKSATFKLKEIESVERYTNENENHNHKYFIEVFNNPEDSEIVIYHLILAMHGTEAGDYYNEFVYNFLSKQFDSNPIHRKFPIIEDVKNQYILNSDNLMVTPIQSISEFEDSESEIKLKTDKEGKEKKLEFKRCLIDELGFSNFYGAYFEPKYGYFKTNICKKPYLCVQLEIPGESKITKFNATLFNNIWNINIQGAKTNNIIDINKEEMDEKNKDTNNPILYGNREKGIFNFTIKLNAEDFQLAAKSPEKDKTKKVNGLLCYYFPLIGGTEEEGDEEEF